MSSKYSEERKKYNREYHKKWYEKNKEKRKKQMREKYHNDYKDSEHLREYLEKNREKLLPQLRENSKKLYRKKREESFAAIYSIKNKITGVEYIGETSFYDERERRHKIELNSKTRVHGNKRLQEDYSKYGQEFFDFIVLEKVDRNNFESNEELVAYLRTREEEIIREKILAEQKLYNVLKNPNNPPIRKHS